MFILINFNSYSQKISSDTIYINIDNTKNQKLFVFKKDKTNKHATIKVFNYGYKRQKIDKNDIVKVNPQPPIHNYYEYYSIDSPKHILSIKNLKILSVEVLSKNQKNTKYN
ncbi:hypothetical protein DMB65_06690 [Flavobacterium cheongpyeongense]|uniref:Uncharacterized protein n=1 Tax=Flavobacterium cheongpyeongense TaxID=2212651 RepID=A0A2V4BSS0_9FLAO|nr:hypothetical protein DMB65_06690 [Flavobacterium cheongpyeongense]